MRWITPTTASAAAESLRMVGEIMSRWFPVSFQARVTKVQDSANPGSSQVIRRRDGSLRSRAVARLLVVEDDAAISEPLVRALAREGHEVEHVDRGEAALDRLDLEPVDLVVLDVGLPDVDGVEVCRRARAAHPRLAILMLTARSSELDEVLGLDAGADDYVTKPFTLAVLLARVRALLRREPPQPEGPLEAAGVRVDRAGRRAWRDERELDLSPKEFDLLCVLMETPGVVVRREQLMERVWDRNWWGSTKTLDVHVGWLRRKLGDPALIATARGIGFRFEVP